MERSRSLHNTKFDACQGSCKLEQWFLAVAVPSSNRSSSVWRWLAVLRQRMFRALFRAECQPGWFIHGAEHGVSLYRALVGGARRESKRRQLSTARHWAPLTVAMALLRHRSTGRTGRNSPRSILWHSDRNREPSVPTSRTPNIFPTSPKIKP